MSGNFSVSTAHLVGLLVSDVIFVCSFVISRPLYFCYFAFLLPYVWNLAAFLYPLFVTSVLVLVALCTGVEKEKFSRGLDGCGIGYLEVLYNSVADRLLWERNCDRNEEEFECLQDFGMFEMLFGSSVMEDEGNPQVLEESSAEAAATQDSKSSEQVGESNGFASKKVESNSTPSPKLENSFVGMEEKRLENFLKILDQFERMASNVDEKKNAVQLKCTKTNKVVEKMKAESPVNIGFEAAIEKVNPAVKVSVNSSNGEKQDNTTLVIAHSQKIGSTVDHMSADDGGNTLKVENVDDQENGGNRKMFTSSGSLDQCNLGTYGSMRKEKEWKRTLACKLFEERHNVGGGEGMDSLWEAYEMDSNKATKPKSEKKKKKDKMKKEVECYSNGEEEEVDDAQLCCLQALKFSTGKMNLGMGRPNLVKITKAIKGFGWLHQVTKHSKKVHNSGDRY